MRVDASPLGAHLRGTETEGKLEAEPSWRLLWTDDAGKAPPCACCVCPCGGGQGAGQGLPGHLGPSPLWSLPMVAGVPGILFQPFHYQMPPEY